MRRYRETGGNNAASPAPGPSVGRAALAARPTRCSSSGVTWPTQATEDGRTGPHRTGWSECRLRCRAGRRLERILGARRNMPGCSRSRCVIGPGLGLRAQSCGSARTLVGFRSRWRLPRSGWYVCPGDRRWQQGGQVRWGRGL